MKQIPNVDSAYVEDSKIIDYLLSSVNPRGRDKAAFFRRFGFSLQDWTVLRDALLEHARANEAEPLPPNSYGIKYTVTGPLCCPDGRMPRIRAVWIVDVGQSNARIVTVVPD